jgi:hypothetical protein
MRLSKSFRRNNGPSPALQKGRDSSRECGLFHHLFPTLYRVVSFGRASASEKLFREYS